MRALKKNILLICKHMLIQIIIDIIVNFLIATFFATISIVSSRHSSLVVFSPISQGRTLMNISMFWSFFTLSPPSEIKRYSSLVFVVVYFTSLNITISIITAF